MALALQETSVSLFHAHGSNLSLKPTRFQRAAYFGRWAAEMGNQGYRTH